MNTITTENVDNLIHYIVIDNMELINEFFDNIIFTYPFFFGNI